MLRCGLGAWGGFSGRTLRGCSVGGKAAGLRAEVAFWLLKTERVLGSEQTVGLCSTRPSPLSSRGQCGHCQEWPPRKVRCESEKAPLSQTHGLKLQWDLDPGLRCPLCWKPDLYWAHGLLAPGGSLWLQISLMMSSAGWLVPVNKSCEREICRWKTLQGHSFSLTVLMTCLPCAGFCHEHSGYSSEQEKDIIWAAQVGLPLHRGRPSINQTKV